MSSEHEGLIEIDEELSRVLELLKEFYDIAMLWYSYSPVEAKNEEEIIARVKEITDDI